MSYVSAVRQDRLDNAPMFSLEKLRKDTMDRYKEGQRVKLILANDRSDHGKHITVNIVKFYPLFVHVRLSEYETLGLTYIDFAKAARRGSYDNNSSN